MLILCKSNINVDPLRITVEPCRLLEIPFSFKLRSHLQTEPRGNCNPRSRSQYVEGNLLKSCGIHDNDYHSIKPHTSGGHNQQRMKSPLSGPYT